jgi:predicted esterase
MNSTEKEISYLNTNSYSTLNKLTQQTKTVWFVCHGMGYLSRYFLKYFKGLNPEEHYIIAPQAPSKFYIQPDFKHVGANWLTKENTATETENILLYFDAIFDKENLSKQANLFILGYSQGVSVAMRYIAHRQIQCNELILLSGGIPKELTAEDFKFFKGNVKLSYGIYDEYLNEERMTAERNKIKELFQHNIEIIPFNDKHVVNIDLIEKLGKM